MTRRSYEESREPVELDDVYCEYETDKAILCTVDGKKVWIPKSILHDDSEVYEKDDTGTLIVPRWFAEKEGLV